MSSLGHAALVATAVALSGCSEPRVYPQVGSVVPELVGRSSNGQHFKLSSIKKNARLLFFGYTSCPDVCPLTLLTLRKALKDADTDASKVAVIFVSVDPERDEESVLDRYVAAFGPWLIAVRPESLEKTVADFGLIVERVPAVGSSTAAKDTYTINHTATVVLLDAVGTVRARFPHGTPPEEITPIVRSLL